MNYLYAFIFVYAFILTTTIHGISKGWLINHVEDIDIEIFRVLDNESFFKKILILPKIVFYYSFIMFFVFPVFLILFTVSILSNGFINIKYLLTGKNDDK